VTALPQARGDANATELARYEHLMAMPILLAAVLPIVFALAGRESIVSTTVLVVAWVVFIADYVVHLRLLPGYARSRQGIVDIVVVVLTAPWFLIPGLGDARFLALARLARLARVAKAGGQPLRKLGAQIGQVGLVVGALVFTCAYVAYSAERATNDSFGNFGDALWWATVTITTVGYGDIFPVTSVGRTVAGIAMFSGLGVLGVLAGTLASFFGFGDTTTEAETSDPTAADESDEGLDRDDIHSQLAAIRLQVADLDRAIASIQSGAHR